MVDGSRQIFSFFGCTYLALTIYLVSLSVAKISKHLSKQWRGSKALATAGWQRRRSPGTKVTLVASFLPMWSTKVESLQMHRWVMNNKTQNNENNNDKENSNDNDLTYILISSAWRWEKRGKGEGKVGLSGQARVWHLAKMWTLKSKIFDTWHTMYINSDFFWTFYLCKLGPWLLNASKEAIGWNWEKHLKWGRQRVSSIKEELIHKFCSVPVNIWIAFCQLARLSTS